MASRRVQERRAYHKRYKEDVARTGKPFFPYAMFHDTVMSLVVVVVIIGLACVWYFTADGSVDAGWLGPHYTEQADPGTTDFVPRPDWYFYFLFYLLRTRLCSARSGSRTSCSGSRSRCRSSTCAASAG
jgi:menaquinol-cytochrome c reductase cytochrome b/c subunit